MAHVPRSGEELIFAGDVSKESAVLGWIVENTKDEDDPTENKKTAAEERKRADAEEQGPRKIRTPKQEARCLSTLPDHIILCLFTRCTYCKCPLTMYLANSSRWRRSR